MATFFQVPGDRVLNDPASGLQAWPQSPDGYRLFVTGNTGAERIGIHLGEQIELQLTGGKDCKIETQEAQRWRRASPFLDPEDAPSPVRVSKSLATSDSHKFSLTAYRDGFTTLYATDAAENIKATLQVAAGNFEQHPDMLVDLIAETCSGSDPLKIHALQRLLNNEYRGKDAHDNDIYTNPDNIFNQNATCNYHTTYGNMACGIVAKWRGTEIFDQVAEVADDWYKRPLHEPLTRKISRRSDLKYKPERIRTLETHIFQALRNKKAVRVGVVDHPEWITPKGGALVAYDSGGHTVLIVGATNLDDDNWKFLYIDPWGGGS